MFQEKLFMRWQLLQQLLPQLRQQLLQQTKNDVLEHLALNDVALDKRVEIGLHGVALNKVCYLYKYIGSYYVLPIILD